MQPKKFLLIEFLIKIHETCLLSLGLFLHHIRLATKNLHLTAFLIANELAGQTSQVSKSQLRSNFSNAKILSLLLPVYIFKNKFTVEYFFCAPGLSHNCPIVTMCLIAAINLTSCHKVICVCNYFFPRHLYPRSISHDVF